MGIPLGPGGLNLHAIIAAAAAAATAAVTQGYAADTAAASTSVADPTPLAHVLSSLNLPHLRFICRVVMETKIHWIWLEVCRAPTKSVVRLTCYGFLC